MALAYVNSVLTGKRNAGADEIAACRRFLADCERPDLELRTKDPDFVIGIIERTMVHRQGETLDGTPLAGKPFLLQPWQIFCVYNLVGFYFKGTQERRYKEGFIYVPRKNGKTSFIGGLAFALALLERRSGARIYIVAASLKQAQQAFDFILFSLRASGMIEGFRVRDNNAEHSIRYEFTDDQGRPAGSIGEGSPLCQTHRRCSGRVIITYRMRQRNSSPGKFPAEASQTPTQYHRRRRRQLLLLRQDGIRP